MLQDALEVCVQVDKFPKSAIEAYVVVLEAGGSHILLPPSYKSDPTPICYCCCSNHLCHLINTIGVLSAAMCCATLAIANAGIEMYDLVAACSAVSQVTEVVLGRIYKREEEEYDFRLLPARPHRLRLQI